MAKKKLPEQPITVKNQPVAEATTTSSSSLVKYILPGLLFLLALLLYSNTFKHRFVLDDHGIIKNNKYTKAPISLENTKTIFSTPLRKGDVSDLENSLYRPFVKQIFNIEWNVFKGDPHSFHVVNTIFYAITCVFIFFVLYDMMKKKWVIPFLISLLFLVHPLHVESVANVKSADEILSLLGIVMALRCIQLYVTKQKALYLGFAILSFLMGSFSKESTIVALAIFPLFIYFYTEADLKKNGMISAVMALCSGFFLLCRHFSLRGYPEPSPLSAMDNYLVECPNGASRIASAINTLGLYLKTFFIPHPLSCDYSYSSLSPVTFASPYFLLAFAVLTALFVFALMKLKVKENIAFGILWFFISISIVSNVFFLIGTSFGERLMFTPSLGLTMALVFALAHFLKTNSGNEGFLTEFKKAPLLFGIVLLVSAVFAVKTYSRNADWKTDFKLFSRDINYYPNATHLLFYMGNHLSGNERKEVLNYEMIELGYTYQQIMDSSAKENNNSIYYFTKSLSIFPALPSDGYNQLGKAYYNSGQLDSAEKYYNMAFERDTTNGIFINNLGTVYYTQASRLVPIINNYGSAGRVDSANFYFQKRVNDVLKSRVYFIKAHQKDSTESDFTNNIACSYGDLGVPDSAIFWFEKSVKLDPLDTTALKFLEITWRNLQNNQKADEWHKKFMDAKTIHLQRLAE